MLSAGPGFPSQLPVQGFSLFILFIFPVGNTANPKHRKSILGLFYNVCDSQVLKFDSILDGHFPRKIIILKPNQYLQSGILYKKKR